MFGRRKFNRIHEIECISCGEKDFRGKVHKDEAIEDWTENGWLIKEEENSLVTACCPECVDLIQEPKNKNSDLEYPNFLIQ